jgi:predicted phage terminase large subunit-like protein
METCMPVTETAQTIELRPQPGKQEFFLSTSADLGFYGGAAGGGKTWALLMEPLYHYKTPGFGAVIFRRTYPEIVKKGGMWEESEKLYRLLGGTPREGPLEWAFTLPQDHQTTIGFAHCQHEKDVLSWKGAQIPLIGIDQVESFTEFQFWYLLSRNRSMCGVRPYLRATCNPVPDDDAIGGWLHRLIQWWIDPETGLSIEGRSGVVRWFVRMDEQLLWANSPQQLVERYPGDICPLSVHDCADFKGGLACPKHHAKSLTFISSRLQDNPALMRADPGYHATLLSLPLVERERLLGGNWNARPTAGKVFNLAWFEIVRQAPMQLTRVRFWDKAGTEEGGDWTAGVKMGKDPATGLVYVEDVVRGQWSAHQREQVIKQTAQLDGHDVQIYVEQEPGSGGKESAQTSILNLQGYVAFADPVRGDKVKRAYPLSAYAEARNVKIVEGQWNRCYLDELHGFDPENSLKKDQVDASSGAFNKLSLLVRPLVLQSGGQTLGIAGEQENPVLSAIRNQGCYWPEPR